VSPHPASDAVLAWFAGAIDGRALVAALTRLRSDPDGRVQAIPRPDLCASTLVHWPTRARRALPSRPAVGAVAPCNSGPRDTPGRGVPAGIARMGYCPGPIRGTTLPHTHPRSPARAPVSGVGS